MLMIEAKLAIQDLVARYNHTLDGGDYAGFLDCWAEDAVFEGLGRRFETKAQLKVFVDAYEKDFRQRYSGLKHFTVNVLSEIDGDRATSTAYLQLVRTGSKGVVIIFTARYEDELRCVDGRWLFTRRKLHQDMPPAGTPSPATPPTTN